MVNYMRLSDLQSKEVISIKDGSQLGNIIDADVSEDGMVLKIITYNKKGGIFSIKNREEATIKWDQIKKIGEDVILVDENS